jgi:hypothetical protein
VQQEGGTQYSSTWIGIDGDNNGTVLQIGTEGDNSCCLFPPQYYAWYELFPANPVSIPNPVSPGDLMEAVIAPRGGVGTVTPGSPATWTMTLTNLTKGWQFAIDQTYTGMLSSAEWIEEAPSTCSNNNTTCTPLPLANYGSVTFDIDDVVCPRPGATSATDCGSPNFAANQSIAMVQQNGNLTIYSVPSNPDGDVDGFAVAYKLNGLGPPQPPGPVFLNAGLPNAVVNQPYSESLSQGLELIQDSAPLWQLVGGSLPSGFSWNPQSGVMAGTPTNAGAFAFTFLVTDNDNPGASAQQQISFNVMASPPPPNFSLVASPSPVICAKSTIITVTPMNGFSGQVNLSAAPDAAWSTEFNPPTVTLPGMNTSKLTVGQGDPCDAGPNSVQVIGSSGSLSHTLNIGVKTTGDGHCGRVVC